MWTGTHAAATLFRTLFIHLCILLYTVCLVYSIRRLSESSDKVKQIKLKSSMKGSLEFPLHSILSAKANPLDPHVITALGS